MKIKILKPLGWYNGVVGREFEVDKYEIDDYLRFKVNNHGWVYIHNCVITELPESFCVKRCDDKEKWKKYIQWLNKTCKNDFSGNGVNLYYGSLEGGAWYGYGSFGTEIHIDDMIKHIEYMESQLTVKMDKEFDLTTNEGRLAYAKKHYPIGTKYIPVYRNGNNWEKHLIQTVSFNASLFEDGRIEGGKGYIYANGEWAEIIKEEVKETIMETQKLSRQGLKEIHSVACTSWKKTLVDWAKNRNIFKEYIELSQEEVNKMFDACTKEQLPIVSKYLKQDDKSVYLTNIKTDSDSIWLGDNCIITPRKSSEYENKAFNLDDNFKWEIKKDSLGILCLIPTKKK